MDLWALKYAPSKSSEIKGRGENTLNILIDFVKNYKKQKKKAMILYGPAGTGKTSSVVAIAKELDLELIEINASDQRNKDQITSRIGSAINQMSLFSKGKIILIDEVDGVAGNSDRGGISALSAVIKKSSFPIIMTANDPFHKKFSSLRKSSQMIEFSTLPYTVIKSILMEICKKEEIEYDETALTMLARYANGDLRAGITDLQALCESTKKLEKKDLEDVFDREKTETMIDALMRIFKSTKASVILPALDNVDEDMDQFFFWIDENLPKEYTKIKDLAAAYDNISLADVFKGRIRKWQYWRYLVYVKLLLTAGVGLAKEEKYPGFNKYTKTTRILKMWQANMKNMKKKSISEKISDVSHTSTKRAMHDIYPYLKLIFQNSKEMAITIADDLELDDGEIAYLKR